MERRVVITGLGAITPIGNNVVQTWNGIKERYGENYSDIVKQRTEYELGIISKMGYIDYYLIVWDYIHYAKSVGIPVGPRTWFRCWINSCLCNRNNRYRSA